MHFSWNKHHLQLFSIALGLILLWFGIAFYKEVSIKPGLIIAVNLVLSVGLSKTFLTRRQILLSLWLSMLIVIYGLITQPLYFGARFVSFFNNPNQLAFWSVLMILLFHKFKSNLGVFFGIVVAILSLSRGAVLFLLVYFFYKFRKSLWRTVTLAMVVAILAYFFVNFQVENLSRVNNGSELSFIEERSLDRLILNPYGLIFGVQLFYDNPNLGVGVAGEVHNAIGNLLYDGGIIFVILVSLNYLVVRRGAMDPLVLILLFTYGLGHTVFRFPFLWITLILMRNHHGLDNS